MEYEGANLVPTALSHFCLKVLSKNCRKLHLKTVSVISTKKSVVTFSFSLLCKCFLTEARPSSCAILGYRSTTSIVHGIEFFGEPPNSFQFFEKMICIFHVEFNFFS